MALRLRGIQGWLICVLAVAVLPAGGLLARASAGLRRAVVAGVDEELQRAARLGAERVRARFEVAHGALAAFATLPPVLARDGAACSAIAREIVEREPAYLNVAAATADGRVFCSSAAAPPGFAVEDRLFFRRAMESSEAVVGEVVVGRAVRRPVIHVAQPVLDDHGGRSGVVFAAIDPGELSELLRDLRPSDAVATVVDGRGRILARHPHPGRLIGKPLDAAIVRRMLDERERAGEVDVPDDIPRLYAFAPVNVGRGASDVRVAMSVPRAAALAAVASVGSRTLRWYVAIALSGVVAAWAIGEFAVGRRIRRLASAARRATRGELGARSGVPARRDEIDELAAAIDDMAARIESLTRQNRVVLESAAVGIFAANPQGTITFMNPAGARMLRWASAAAPGAAAPQHVADVACRGDAADRLLRVLVDGVVQRGDDAFQRADGSEVSVSWVASLLRDGDDVVEVVVAFHDVSDRFLLEQQVRQLQKMEALGRLAGGVAHDFNNLLSVILGAGQSLQQELTDADARRAAVDDIVAAGTRGAALTRQLLAFSRSEAAEPHVVDPNDVMEGLRTLIARLLRDDVVPTFSLRSGGRVRIGSPQLEQVVLNLVINARDAMPNGGTVTVETADVELDGAAVRRRLGASPGKYVMIAVSDDGTGMDDATLARLFQPFFTTKARGKGTGLGLSTVWSIVKGGGGEIHVDSVLGEGSSFKIYLPVVEPCSGRPPGSEAAPVTHFPVQRAAPKRLASS